MVADSTHLSEGPEEKLSLQTGLWNSHIQFFQEVAYGRSEEN